MNRSTGAAEAGEAIEPEQLSERPNAQGLGIALVGFVIAAWGAMCGIGGGIFAVPVLHYVYKLKLRDSVVTSLSLVAASTASATIAEGLHDDNALDWRIVLCLIAGSLIGAQGGFYVSHRIKTRPLKIIFFFVLTFVGVKIMGIVPESFAAGGGLRVLDSLGTRDFVIAALIGMCGGFVAPLLGIGGGLVVVPALLVFIPSIGHLGARACSMAMAVVTSTRSMMLYYRVGELNLRRSMSFAIGAAVGATVGVQLVHIPEVEDLAKKMLAGTLFIVAARFAYDIWIAPKPETK